MVAKHALILSLRAEPGLFGVVGSVPTLYRTMRAISSEGRAGLTDAMGMVRQKVWDRLADTDTVVLDIDSSLPSSSTKPIRTARWMSFWVMCAPPKRVRR